MTQTYDIAPDLAALLGKTMPEILDNAAERWGADLAMQEVEGEQRSLTWAEFRERVRSLRTGLESIGVSVGDRVGILIRNQLEFPISWFAVVEAGAAVVPLNPKYTSREIDFVLSDADATWLIGDGALIDQHANGDRIGPVAIAQTVAINDSEKAAHSYATLAATEPTERIRRADPLEVVNIQFTSGTTGLPKGCLLTHEYWVDIGVFGAALSVEPVKRLLADHPFYYMQNQAYLMTAIVTGGALFITQGLSRRKLMGWLHDYQIDFAWIDEDMLEYPPDPRDSEVRINLAPVAGLPAEDYQRLRDRYGIEGRELYASTEAGYGTYVPADRPDLTGTYTMGFCFPHRESKVIDENGIEVPIGTPGELCLRGPGMMLGYHNRPEANEELFLDGGWFRTGDAVIKDEEGLHYFVGRLKDMIRRSGENISAVEIEMQIYGMPEVANIAAVPVPDPEREEEVKVIIVLAEGAELTPQQVVDWASERLAPFKVPRYIEFRDELPYTESGKVHKAALRAEEQLHPGVTDMKAVR